MFIQIRVEVKHVFIACVLISHYPNILPALMQMTCNIMSQWSVLLCLFPWLGMLRTMSKWRAGQKLILED